VGADEVPPEPTPAAPPFVEPEPVVESTPSPVVEPTPGMEPAEPFAPIADEQGFEEAPPLAGPGTVSAEQEQVFGEFEGQAPAASAPEPAAGSPDMDALVDEVVEKVVAKLADKVVREIAWEVVPDLAQTLIQKEIDALKSKIPK
jgi:hypothetical protein